MFKFVECGHRFFLGEVQAEKMDEVAVLDTNCSVVCLERWSLSMKIRVLSSMWWTLKVLPNSCIFMNAERDWMPDCPCIFISFASSVAVKFTEQRNVIGSALGGRPDFLELCFIG